MSKKQKRAAESGFKVIDRREANKEPAPETPVVEEQAPAEVEEALEEVVEEPEVAPAPFNPYEGGIEAVVLAGSAAPMCGGVLCRAVLEADYTVTGQAMKDIAMAKQAMCFEILAIAPDVPAEVGLEVGQHCFHVSASSDPIDPTDKACRIFVVHWMDIRLAWWPPTRDEETGERVFYEAPAPKGEVVNVGSPAANGWPWRAEYTGKGKAWHVLDVNGAEIVSALTEATAKRIADAANERAARHDPPAPMSVTVPAGARESVLQAAEAFEARQPPPAPAQPQVDMQALLEGIVDPSQRTTVALALQTNGLASAKAIADGFRLVNQRAQQQQQPPPGWTPPNPEDVPRQHGAGAWGVYLPGQTQPAARFTTSDEAVAWADKTLPGVQFEVTQVDRPPNWSAPRQPGPVPLTPAAFQQMTGGMGASWGQPPAGAAGELARLEQMHTTAPLGIPTAPSGPRRRR